MKYLLLMILMLFIAIAVGSSLVEDTGYVLLSISGWKLETSLVLFSIFLFLVFLIAYFFIRSFIRTWRLPADLRAWKTKKNQSLIEKFISEGLINMIEGNWEKAEKIFQKTAALSKDPYIIYLQAAKAAQKMRAYDKQNEYLQSARSNNPNAILTVELIQAKLRLEENQVIQAITILKKLLEEWPKQNHIKELLIEAYILTSNWQALLELLSSIEKNKYFTNDSIINKKIKAYIGLLNEAGHQIDRKKLDNIWDSIPRKLKQKVNLVEAYVIERLKLGETSDCEVLLRATIKQVWDRKLVRLYGSITSLDSDKQLETAESWLKKYGSDPVLFLTLGKISIRNSLWSKAKEYLQKSNNLAESPDAYFELANLYRNQGDYKQSVIYFEKGIDLKESIQ